MPPAGRPEGVADIRHKGTSKNLERMARMGILDPDDLPAGRQGRKEERILERNLRLRNNEVWIKKSHMPKGQHEVLMPPEGGSSRYP